MAGRAFPAVYPPLPLLPGQQERVRTLWTRLTHALAVAVIVLTPWLLLRVGVAIYLVYVDSQFAPEELFVARFYVAFVAAELALAVVLACIYWALGRRLRRSGGRPTRTTVGILVTATLLLGLLAVDAFTFALIRGVAG